MCSKFFCFFFFNDPATTEIYTSLHTLSLHDALPISEHALEHAVEPDPRGGERARRSEEHTSELQSRNDISYAVFCLKKKKNQINGQDLGVIALESIHKEKSKE